MGNNLCCNCKIYFNSIIKHEKKCSYYKSSLSEAYDLIYKEKIFNLENFINYVNKFPNYKNLKIKKTGRFSMLELD